MSYLCLAYTVQYEDDKVLHLPRYGLVYSLILISERVSDSCFTPSEHLFVSYIMGKASNNYNRGVIIRSDLY